MEMTDETRAVNAYWNAVAERTARRVEHDHQAAVGDVPADVEIDDTETADRKLPMSPRMTTAVLGVIAEIEAAP